MLGVMLGIPFTLSQRSKIQNRVLEAATAAGAPRRRTVEFAERAANARRQRSLQAQAEQMKEAVLAGPAAVAAHPRVGQWEDDDHSHATAAYESRRIDVNSEQLVPVPFELADFDASRPCILAGALRDAGDVGDGDEYDDIPGVVLDPGSSTIKVGYIGDDAVLLSLSSTVGVVDGRWLVGHELPSIIAGDVHFPLVRGLVVDWAKAEHVWRHVFCDQLRIDMSKHCVLVAEAPLTPKAQRERMASCFVLTLGFRKMCFCLSALLSIYASGRCSALSVESGHGVTSVLPVWGGYLLPHACFRTSFGGHDVTQCLASLLESRGIHLPLASVRAAKEQLCTVVAAERDETLTTPNGMQVVLDREVLSSPAAMFHDEHGRKAFGTSFRTIQSIVYSSIIRCDVDLQQDLRCNIVLAGGNTLLHGFAERLSSELQLLFKGRADLPAFSAVVIPPPPGEVRACVPLDHQGHLRFKVVAPPERLHSVFFGGSILGSLRTSWSSFFDREELTSGTDKVHHLR